MRILIIQVFASVFILFILLKVFFRLRDQRISRGSFAFWTLLWVAGGILFWHPELSNRAARFLQVGRGVDAIMYVSIVSLFYLLFRVFNRFEKLEGDITRLVRELAILEKTRAGDPKKERTGE